MPRKASGRTKSRIKPVGDLVAIFTKAVELLVQYGGPVIKLGQEAFHKMKLRFQGKTLAVIGPKASGKTTFLEILRNPNYQVDVGDYTPTVGKQDLTTVTIRFKPPIDGQSDGEIRFKLRKPKDVGGEPAFREKDWPEVCKDADFVFYIMDASDFENKPQYRDRVREDIEWIAENNQMFAQGFEIVVFANKIDKLGEPETWKSWGEKNVPIIEQMIKKELGDFGEHLSHIHPVSFASSKRRANAITDALRVVTERRQR